MTGQRRVAGRIGRLTDDQHRQLGDWRHAWRTDGRSTQPADRPAAEDAIRLAYACAGFPGPERIVWCESPMGLALTNSIVLNQLASLPPSVWTSVWPIVGDCVRDSIKASVGDHIWALIGVKPWCRLSSSIRDRVGPSVKNRIADGIQSRAAAAVAGVLEGRVADALWRTTAECFSTAVQDVVTASVHEVFPGSLQTTCFGQGDSTWLSFYEYCGAVLGLETPTACLRALIVLAKNAGWWIPHARLCWVSERPNCVERDLQRRLHNLTGPAVQYPDGWGVYAIHDMRIPARRMDRPYVPEVRT
jgi:hypothetical protein